MSLSNNIREVVGHSPCRLGTHTHTASSSLKMDVYILTLTFTSRLLVLHHVLDFNSSEWRAGRGNESNCVRIFKKMMHDLPPHAGTEHTHSLTSCHDTHASRGGRMSTSASLAISKNFVFYIYFIFSYILIASYSSSCIVMYVCMYIFIINRKSEVCLWCKWWKSK